jgi:hypothetical protein
MYDGRVRRTLVGSDITERALIASALSIDSGTQGAATMTPATA